MEAKDINGNEENVVLENEKNNVIDVDEENDDRNDNGKFTSLAWKYFKRPTKKPFPKTINCSYCKAKFKFDTKNNGTSAMLKHLKAVCRTSPIFKGKKETHIDGKKQKTIGFKIEQKQIGGHGISMVNHSFSQERCRKIIARMCIKDNRPFSIVDDEGFKEMLWELERKFKVPSRWTVARDCLEIYKEKSCKLKYLLNGQRVSLTTDTWSSIQNINYMCLTAHWIDDDWIMRKKILNFCQIANHKGVTIGKLVSDCLKVWGIERVFTITVDNASSNDGAIRFLKEELNTEDSILEYKYLHLRCCAHIVNLVVKEGLHDQFESIVRIRNAVRHVRSSPSRYAKFKDNVEKAKISCSKKLCLDVDTRWNSTYLMLDTAVKYAMAMAMAFKKFNSDVNYSSYFSGGDEEDFECNTRSKKKKSKVLGAPTPEDFKKASYLVDFLQIFYDVTLKISGSKYVTSNLFFNELVRMHVRLGRMCRNEDVIAHKMAIKMKEKYDKYWENMENMNNLLYIAAVLDPTRKLEFVDYCFKQIYGPTSPRVKQMNERVVNTLIELYAHYKIKEDDSNLIDDNSGSSASFMDVDDLESGFLHHLEEKNEIGKTEVHIYLGDRVEKVKGDNFDLLTWWKNNALKFPIISKIAKHVLAMPISTVANESAFSTGGRVIDPFRSSLTTKTAEALIFTQDWIRSSSIDIESQLLHAQAMEELHEQLEKIEIDEFSSPPKFFKQHDEA